MTLGVDAYNNCNQTCRASNTATLESLQDGSAEAWFEDELAKAIDKWAGAGDLIKLSVVMYNGKQV